MLLIYDQKCITYLTYRINGACIEVQKVLGSGLAEVVYHKALIEKFKQRDLKFESEFNRPVLHKGTILACDFKCEFFD